MTETTTETTTTTTTPSVGIQGLTALNVEAYSLLSAEGNFAQGRATLYDGDGQPLYAPAEHQRQLEALQVSADAIVTAAVEVADRHITQATAAIRRAEQGDPALVLDDATLGRAAALKIFSDQDVADLDGPALLERLHDVRAGGDRAHLYALWHGANRHVGAMEREVRTNPDARPAISAQDRARIGEALDAIAADLRGPEARKIAEIERQNLQQAMQVKSRANRLYDEAHDKNGQLERALRASGRYSI